MWQTKSSNMDSKQEESSCYFGKISLNCSIIPSTIPLCISASESKLAGLRLPTAAECRILGANTTATFLVFIIFLGSSATRRKCVNKYFKTLSSVGGISVSMVFLNSAKAGFWFPALKTSANLCWTVSGMRGSWISRRNSLKRLVNKATSVQLSTDEKSSLSINNLKIEMKKIKTLSGEVHNVEISRVTQQLPCSKSHDFLAHFALAHSKINQIA